MPRYFFGCDSCGANVHRIFRTTFEKLLPEKKADAVKCKCGATLVRVHSPPTTQVKEILDNGAMAHRIERLADVERMAKDRARNDPSKR
jgi:hypothetical protein